MNRFPVLVSLSVLLLSICAIAQETGRLEITVQRAAGAGSLAGPIMDAKVIVVHWTKPGMHPTMVQDKSAATNQMGACTLDLPPGTYDIFVSASDLAPAAFRREIKVGETASITASLRSAPLQVRPVQ